MKNVPWSPPDIGEQEKKAAKEVIDSGWLTQGKITEGFENDIKDYIGCRNAVVVNNGTSALIAALLAHGIGPGDEVIVPTYTFIATINSVLAVGAKPVLVDCDPETFNTTPEMVKPLITDRTKAVMPVDVAGMPVDIDAFNELCDDKGILMIEDAAEAMGAEYKGRKIGSFSHTSIFSFHMAKVGTAVEGGCILTGDEEIAERCSMIRNHGMRGKYDYKCFGLNLRITDVQSAIGRVQLKKVDRYVKLRNQLADLYMELLGDDFEYQETPKYVTKHPYMIFSLLADAGKRDEIIKKLNGKGVGTRICWLPAHRQEYHSSLFKGSYPNSESIASRIINPPMGNDLKEDDIRYVCEVLKNG